MSLVGLGHVCHAVVGDAANDKIPLLDGNIPREKKYVSKCKQVQNGLKLGREHCRASKVSNELLPATLFILEVQ